MDQTNNEQTDELPPESEPGWAELNHDCLTNIIFRLSFEHRSSAMFVCKPWLLACKDPHLNTSFVLESMSNPESTRWSPSEFRGNVDSILKSVAEWSQGLLREIRTRDCSTSSLSIVAERCPNLEVLSIDSSPNLTNATMADIAFRCPLIKELDISYCYGISHESLLLVGKSCPNLTILKRNTSDLQSPASSSREGEITGIPFEYLQTCAQEADAIGESMPNLKHLEIRFSHVTAKGLGLICAGCLKLEYLDVYGSAYLTSCDIDNAISELKNLKEIKRSYFYVPMQPDYENYVPPPGYRLDQTNEEGTDKPPPESESGWAELTHDCLTNIILRLSFEYRWHAMFVCKPWLLACKDSHLNSSFILEPKSWTEIIEWCTSEFGRKVDSILRSVAKWSQGVA